MPSAKYSISKPSAIIALKYGKNVSRGILEMQKKIVEQEEEISTMGAWIAGFLQDLRKIIKECVK